MVNSYMPLCFTIIISFSLAAASAFSTSHSQPKARARATGKDLLSVLGPTSAAATINPDVSQRLKSSLKFLVPFEPVNSGFESEGCSLGTGLCSETQSRIEEENRQVWWPPVAVRELARRAVESGGDGRAFQGTLKPERIEIPDVEGSVEARCTLSYRPNHHFRAEEVNSYFKFLFRLIESRAPSVGLNVSLTRFDLFHGHLFLASETGRLGILFHAKEYPAVDAVLFPVSQGNCDTGSNVLYNDFMNLRNILWLAPLPGTSPDEWLAPGVLVVLDAHPNTIIYQDLINFEVRNARTIDQAIFGEVTIDVNYLNVGAEEPEYELFNAPKHYPLQSCAAA